MPKLSFKATPAAKARRLRHSEYLRRSALLRAPVQPRLRMTVDRQTGLSHAVMPATKRPVRASDVRRIVADFP